MRIATIQLLSRGVVSTLAVAAAVHANAAPQVQGTLATLRMVGDVNGDGIANQTDLALVQANQGQAGKLAQGDVDGSGFIDAADLTLLTKNLYKRSPSIYLGKIVDTTTPIPSGTGAFSLLNAPVVDEAGNLAFLGSGTTLSGVYKWSANTTSRVADITVAVPGGTGLFENFSGPSISNGKVAFQGVNTSNYGIYSSANGVLSAVVTKATARPEGGTFSTINDPTLTSSALSFVGTRSTDTSAYSVVGTTLTPQVNTTTAIPGGTGAFNSFDNVIADGSNYYFIGRAIGQFGIYKRAGGTLTALLDKNTAVPGTSQKFTTIGNLSEDATNLSFFGIFGGRSGIFSLAGATGQLRKVVDTSTPVPGSTNKFLGFGASSAGGSAVAFVAYDGPSAAPNYGLYAWVNGAITKLIDSSVTIGGKMITSIELSRNAVVGNKVVFQAIFSDFSSGIYSASLLPQRVPGDLNADGKVDATDYRTLQYHLGDAGGYTRGDLNSDGVIDFKDLQLVQKDYGLTGPIPLVGDTDGDGKVTSVDYRTVLANQGKFGAEPQGDFTGDGVVDFADLQLVQLNYGKTAAGAYTPFEAPAVGDDVPAFDGAGVPEPTAAASLTLAALATLARRRTR